MEHALQTMLEKSVCIEQRVHLVDPMPMDFVHKIPNFGPPRLVGLYLFRWVLTWKGPSLGCKFKHCFEKYQLFKHDRGPM